MADTDLTRALEQNGLSSYQAELYVTVLSLRDASVSQLVDACSVPQPRAYDVLRDLDQQGFVETYEQDTLRARAIEPDQVINELQTTAENLIDAADQIGEMWEEPEFNEFGVEIYSEGAAVIRNARHEMYEAENKIHASLSPADLPKVEDSLREAKRNGVFIQLSIHQSDEGDLNIEDVADRFPEIATEVRRVDSFSPLIVLVDGTSAFLAIEMGNANEYGMHVHDQAMTSLYHWYFQIQLWEPCEMVFESEDSDLNKYVNIRDFIRDIEPFYTSGEEVRVTVRGYDTSSKDFVEYTGVVTETIYGNQVSESNEPLSHPYIYAAFVLEVGSEEYSVGGYGAIIEDVRAQSIVIEEVGADR